MAILRVGQWGVARRILATAPARAKMAINMAVQQEAHYFRGKVVEGFRTQAPGGVPFKPLAKSTLAARKFKGFRGTKALIVRGDLRNSISVARPSPGTAFVGVLRSARAKNGKPLVNIAEVHEFGSRPIAIRITPKMRRFLQALNASMGEMGRDEKGRFTKRKRVTFWGNGTGIVIVQIPARPYLRPAFDKYMKGDEVKMRFLARVGLLLGGDFGQMGISIPR
jgi:hypothetical protein